MEYTFEKVAQENLFQVRLKGEFVMYASEANPDKIDRLLFSQGYKNRTEFYRQSVKRHLEMMDVFVDE